MKKIIMLLSTLLTINIYAHWPSIYNPERATYMQDAREKPKESTCVFCTQYAENNNEKHFILKRYKHVFVMLNRFPYQYGHMLIMPNDHVANLDELSPEARCELMEVATQAVTILKETYKIDGVNVGINLGSAAGASKPDHLHVHILPRWYYDTGWLHTIGQTSVMTSDIHEVYKILKAKFIREDQ